MFSSIYDFKKDLKYLKEWKAQKMNLLPMVFKISNLLIESQLFIMKSKLFYLQRLICTFEN